jgi:hypothetical protein
MSSKTEWARGAGVTVSSTEVLTELKLGTPDALIALIKRKAAVALALERGISIIEEDLQSSLDTFYADRDLFEGEQIQNWLARTRIDEVVVRDFIREQLLVERLSEALFPDSTVADSFESDPHQYARAEVYVFSLATEGAADEFILAVKEKEIVPFAERVTIVKRDAPEEIAPVLFGAAPGDLVGRFCVYQVVQRHEARLDESLSDLIRGELMDDLLSKRLEREPLTFLV